MSTPSSRNAPPFPTQTAPPQPLRQSLKRSRTHRDSVILRARDTSIVDQAAIDAAAAQCEDSPNNVISCYPNSSTAVAQHEWATIVWNSRLPQWAQTNLVNLYLFQADTGEQVLNMTNVTNTVGFAGQKHVQVDDIWFGSRGSQWNGQNVSFPFFWIITRNDRPLTNTDLPQPTFTAVQTTFADSIIASMSSSSVAAASLRSAESASLASASSASASLTATPTATSPVGTSSGASNPSGAVPTGAVQSNGGASSFPKWAIAVIVVLGFLALVAFGVLSFFMTRRLRQRRDGMLSHRNSMGSSTPMMANADRGPQSPIIGSSPFTGGGSAAAAAAGLGAAAYGNRAASPTEGHDGASMVSRTSDSGPFSGADAAIMANAFRQALRKPDFADIPVEEGESPDTAEHAHARTALLNQELAEEGREVLSVSSSRGVRVETLSDDGNDVATVQH